MGEYLPKPPVGGGKELPSIAPSWTKIMALARQTTHGP